MNESVDHYLDLPYALELIPEEDGTWFVRVRELPGCVSVGETPDEAVVMIRDAMHGWIEAALEDGDEVPEPFPGTASPKAGKAKGRYTRGSTLELGRRGMDEALDVVISEWNWFFDSDGDVRLSGLIANNSSRPLAAATPQFRLLDGSGKFVGVAFTTRQFEGPLPPGGEGAFSFWELLYGREVVEVQPAGLSDVKFAEE